MAYNSIVYGNKQLYYGSRMIHNSVPALDPFTIRLKFDQGYNPTEHITYVDPRETWTLIDADNNIWDDTYLGTNWSSKFSTGLTDSIARNIVEVIGSNLSGVLDAGAMFSGINSPSTKLRKVVLNKTETITNMTNMFRGQSVDSVTIYDMSGVTSASQMFQASSVSEVHLYNTSNIKYVNVMFAGCRNLTTTPLFDTSGVEEFYFMFDECQNLTSSVAYDLSSARSLQGMFASCNALTTVALMDTRNVTNMSNMFNSCTSLTTLPSFNTENVTRFFRMLYGCTNLETVPLFNTSSATSMEDMCYNCELLDDSALALYQQASSQSVPPTDTSRCFTNCGIYWYEPGVSYNYLAQIPSSWGGTAT